MKGAILLTSLYILLTPLLAHSQSPATAPPQKKINKTFHVPGEYWNEYDRFTDETRVIVGPFPLDDISARLSSEGTVRLAAAVYFPGQTLKEPVADFLLLFASNSKEWEFLKQSRLYFLADGERFSFGEGLQDREVKLEGVKEFIGFRLSRKEFEKLASSKKVELRLGKYEATLTDKHLRAFNELLESATPKMP